MRRTKIFTTRNDFEGLEKEIDIFIAKNGVKVFRTTYIAGARRYDNPVLYCIIEYTTDDIDFCEFCKGVIINDKCIYCGSSKEAEEK